MPARSRILVLSSTFPRWPGDRLPRFVHDLCLELAEEFEVHVLAPHHRGAAVREQVGPLSVFRYRYAPEAFETLAYGGGVLSNLSAAPARAALIPLLVAAQTAAAWRLHHRHRYAALHAHWLLPQGAVAVALARLLRPRPAVVCSSHGGDLFALGDPLSTRAKKTVLLGVDHVTVVSRAMRARCLELGASPERVSVAPMGVDLLGCFKPVVGEARDPRRIVFVGRLVEKKGLIHLIDAMQAIAADHPAARLLVIGDGPDHETLMQRARQVGVSARVEFAGPQPADEVARAFSRAAVAVMPSVVARSGDQEGLGLVAVEAMGCECALVASDLPAVRDTVLDGQTGLLSRPGDPADLAAKVSRLLTDSDLARRLGQAARAFVLEHFDWTVAGQRYRELLLEQIRARVGDR